MGTLAIEHSNIRHVAPHFLYLNSGFGYTLYVRFASKESAMIAKGMLQTNKKSKNIAQKKTLTQLATNSFTRIGQRQFC